MRDQNIPRNAFGRQQLLDSVAAAKAAGAPEVVAELLLDLAQLVKQIGPVTEKPWIEEYKEYVDEAHRLLQGTKNKKLLAYAHRSVNLMFVVRSEVAKQHLETALGLSEECGDDEGRGFALLQLAKLTWSEDGKRSEDLLTEAYLAFELANSDQGIALVLQTRGVHVAGLSERERADLLISAADHFQRDDDLRDARRALVMAFVFGGKAMSEDEMHRIGTWCVDICRKSGSLRDEAYCYRQLKQMFCEREDALNEAKYGELEDSLDDALYGSRLARLESDREILVSNIETADNRTEKKRMKLELVELDRAIADERRKGQV